MDRGKLKWLVVALLFIATGLSFLDRQVLSVAILEIQKDFSLSDIQYGWVNTSFLVGYALTFTIGGWLIDRYGGRIGLAVSVGIWSLANMLHGTITGFASLAFFRFLLGLGEGGCFPGAAKSVSEWFKEKERALANGIAIGGSAIGAVIAPPLTIWISQTFGWRTSFVIPGVIGFVWLLGWLLIPDNRAKRVDISSKSNAGLVKFSKIAKRKEVWIFIVIRFLLDPVLFFIMFWFPKYLSAERNVDYKLIGDLFWIPFLGLGISNILGGWISDRLVTRYHFSLVKSRRTVMGIAALLTIVAPFISMVSSAWEAVLLVTIVLFAHGLWITNYITSIADIFGSKGTSTVVGISGTAGALSALLVNPLIGKVVSGIGYTPLWLIAGCMYPLCFLIFVKGIYKINVVPPLKS